MKTKRYAMFVTFVVGLASSGVLLAQIELDRIRSRVDGHIVTQSDIDRARSLHLIDATESDGAALRALENRLLMLQELERAAPVGPPTGDQLQARRSEWMSRQGGQPQAMQSLRQRGMSDADLDAWLRDDLRIGAYLRRQFGMLNDAARAEAVQEWIGRLRQRADLLD